MKPNKLVYIEPPASCLQLTMCQAMLLLVQLTLLQAMCDCQTPKPVVKTELPRSNVGLLSEMVLRIVVTR
jgi:hypothetical protein